MGSKRFGRIRWRGRSLYIDYHVGGERVRERFGRLLTGQAIERQALESKAREHLETVGLSAAGRSSLTSKFPTYSQAAEFYWDKSVAVKKYIQDQSECRASEKHKLAYTVERFGERTLDSITRADVKQFRMDLRASHPKWGAGTVNRVVDKVGQVFRFAIAQECWNYGSAPLEEQRRYGRMDLCVSLTNPRHGLPKLTEERAEVQIATEEQFRALLDALPEDGRYLALLAAHTGLRPRNVLRLRWDEVDLVGGHLRIETHKGKARLVLALHPDLVQLLTHLHRTRGPGLSEYVVAQPSGRPWAKVPGWYSARRAAGVPEFRFRSVRNAWTSWHVDRGAELGLLQRALGHSTAATTARYYNLAQRASETLVESQPSLLQAGTFL